MDGHGSHIDLESLWTCKQHKFELLFLPFYFSHVLQPLGPSVFSVVKKFYRQQIPALSFLDNAAPVKKERFIAAYHKAKENGVTELIVRAGRAAAGICLLSIDRVVSSSQISRRPVTPPCANQFQLPVESFLSTPRAPLIFTLPRKKLEKCESVGRSTRKLFYKAGKVLAAANTRAAELETENKEIHSQLSLHHTCPIGKETPVWINRHRSGPRILMSSPMHKRTL